MKKTRIICLILTIILSLSFAGCELVKKTLIVVTPAPHETTGSESTSAPSASPDVTNVPESTEAQGTEVPQITETPLVTKAPEITATPIITAKITPTLAPIITATPTVKPTQKPTPTPTVKPENTPKPSGVVAFEADVYMVPCVGQSLAVNTNAGPSTFSSTFPLSYNTSLTRTNLQDMNTGFCEGFDLMAKKCGVSIPSKFKIITCVVDTGGTSINTFVKGTSHYSQIINNVKTAYANCQKQGLTMVVPGFMWTQGEEDMRCGGNYSLYGKGEWDPLKYGTKLASIISDLSKDIKAITGQANDVYCYSYQLACQNTYNRYPRIGLEQAKLAETNDHMILAKTMYDVNYNTEDYVHAPAATYRNMGNYYGMACFTTSVLHEEFKYTHVINVQNNGTEIILTYEVPVKPLTLDTTLVNQLEDGNYGFCIYNIPNEMKYSKTTLGISKSATVIKKVEVVGDDKIKLTLNRPMVSGDTLTYGVNGDGSENITGYNITGADQKSGHISGARGCVRDSSTVKNYNSGSVLHDLYSWAPIFEYKV